VTCCLMRARRLVISFLAAAMRTHGTLGAQPTPVDYTRAIARLDSLIADEVADKRLPGLSIALVDDRCNVWSRVYGRDGPDSTQPATGGAVQRVGSVSKLFTDIAVLQLVEEGRLDLDAPVSRYVGDVLPPEPASARITLRHLMAHRSGLVRELPAGIMYCDVENPARVFSVLFAGGRGPQGPVIGRAMLDSLWTPQFVPAGITPGHGGFPLGFALSELEGQRRVSHGGAIYGFSNELAALPDDRLGVAVVATAGGANAVTERIAEAARCMRTARDGLPLPEIERPTNLSHETARLLAGRYGAGDHAVELKEQSGRLCFVPSGGSARAELRSLNDTMLVVDDRLAYGARIVLWPGAIVSDGRTLRRVDVVRPSPAPARSRQAIGKYRWDYDTLFLLVRDGKLHALWDATPPTQRVLVAKPTQGSRHDRGAAVDLTLNGLRTGRPMAMPGGNDEFSNRSSPDYPGCTSLQRWHRALLRRCMEAEGFTVYEAEWWHFDFYDWRRYPIGTATFEEVERAATARRGDA